MVLDLRVLILLQWLLLKNALAAESALPHILMIVMDDLGFQDLGYHGLSGIQTPTCDKLIKEGIYLDNYYVHPSCSPTRAALMTGRLGSTLGIHSIIQPSDPYSLPLDEVTLPQVLKRSGYQTHGIGKWHLGHSAWSMTPTYRGFDTFYGKYLGTGDHFLHVRKQHFWYDFRFDKEPRCGPGCSQVVDERGNYSTDVFARRTVDILKDYADACNSEKGCPSEPLFVYLAFTAIHTPFQAPEEYVSMYDQIEYAANWTQQYRTYAAMLTAADSAVEQVVTTLKATGLYDDTLIVFTTDNGGYPVNGRPPVPDEKDDRRGTKSTLWEAGISGDGFVSGGALASLGLAAAGSRQSLFHVVDWLPTLAALVGASVIGTKPLDGVNQLSTLQDDLATTPPREEIFLGYATTSSREAYYGPAIRWKDWKLIQGNSGGTRNGPKKPISRAGTNSSYLLFDLTDNRNEVVNVASKHPDIVSLLRSKMKSYYRERYVAPFKATLGGKSCPRAHHPSGTSAIPTVWSPWCDNAQVNEWLLPRLGACSFQPSAVPELKLSRNPGDAVVNGIVLQDERCGENTIFKVTGTGALMTVSTCGGSERAPESPLELAVQRGCDSECVDVAAVSTNECGNGIEVTWNSIVGQMYYLHVSFRDDETSVGRSESKFQVEACVHKVRRANIKKCRRKIRRKCNIPCLDWNSCEIINATRAVCSRSASCQRNCNAWWQCTERVSSHNCTLSIPLGIRPREQAASRKQAIAQQNRICNTNVRQPGL